MRFLNIFIAGKSEKRKNQGFKIIVCLCFISLFLFNYLYINENYNKTNYFEEDFSSNDNNQFKDINNNLQASSLSSMLQDPFTENFDLIRDFFDINYQSGLNYDIPTYYRYGDSNGDILDDTIFSEDNLLYYYSLMKWELTEAELYDTYLDLKETSLWYEANINNFKYGFVRSIDNTTGKIKDDNRYLVDNLIPIFLLIENIRNIDSSIENSINEQFNLINSSEFWDVGPYNGFVHYNSSNIKRSESNFYSVLANLLIHRTPNLDNSIRDRAYQLANLTMIDLNTYMWDSTQKAFQFGGNINWVTSGLDDHFYLSTNALGIIALLEFWIESGMQHNSSYLQKAKQLYTRLDTYLWDSANNLYKNIAKPDWDTLDFSLNLESNSLMMKACLKLFDVSGNFSYYKRALEIYNSFESNLYDSINNAYDFSITNSSKSFHSNLKLCEAYVDAFEIYNSTSLNAIYNVSDAIPNFIFNQDIMNLTSVYSFKKIIHPFYPENKSFGQSTIQYDITNASINYILKYPNGTFFKQFKRQVVSPASSDTLEFPIDDTLPIGEGYYTYIWANTTYFKLKDTVKRFNVISGLINKTIKGLPGVLYQGPLVNVTLFINYTRNENLTLLTSLEGLDIVNFPAKEINFTTSGLIQISFNLTAKFGAEPGTSEIYFRVKKDSILFLEIKKVIEIGYSFDYSNFLYQNKVVKGEELFVSMNIKNYLPNATQSLNVSFTGITENSIEHSITEETLEQNEIINSIYYLKTLESIIDDVITIEMKITINTTEYYSEILTIEIIQKFEIISATFPESISQGNTAYLILIIKNNQENSESFSLYINGIKFGTNIAEMNTGDNVIVAKLVPTINPYEFGIRQYRVKLTDRMDQEIALFFFEVSLELSTVNLVLFYFLPSIVPIGIILYFKNKDIKHKKLRR